MTRSGRRRRKKVYHWRHDVFFSSSLSLSLSLGFFPSQVFDVTRRNMSSRRSVDTTSMEILPATSNSNSLARSKKLPPPPLNLPAPTVNPDDEKRLDSKEQREQRKLSHNCCLSSSSGDCSHQPVPYVNDESHSLFLSTSLCLFTARFYLPVNVRRF